MSEWTGTTVGECFDLEPGFAFKSADFRDNGVPVIKIKNVKAGFFSEHDFDYVDPSFVEKRPAKVARFDDLLISMSGIAMMDHRKLGWERSLHTEVIAHT